MGDQDQQKQTTADRRMIIGDQKRDEKTRETLEELGGSRFSRTAGIKRKQCKECDMPGKLSIDVCTYCEEEARKKKECA